jgi:hypothetical protein
LHSRIIYKELKNHLSRAFISSTRHMIFSTSILPTSKI